MMLMLKLDDDEDDVDDDDDVEETMVMRKSGWGVDQSAYAGGQNKMTDHA